MRAGVAPPCVCVSHTPRAAAALLLLLRLCAGIGLSCVQSISVKTAQSRLRGQTQALYVMTKFNNARFEFIFTSLVKASPRMFQVVQAVARAYETSRLYRDLKLRGALIKDDQLIVLPHEQIFSKARARGRVRGCVRARVRYPVCVCVCARGGGGTA